MIRLMYDVSVEDASEELEWLRDQSIFPATNETWVHDDKVVVGGLALKKVITFGMIINDEQLLFIKLRHSKLKSAVEYRQR